MFFLPTNKFHTIGNNAKRSLFYTSSFSLYSTYFSAYLSQSPSVCPLPINLFNRKDEWLRISEFSIHVHIFMLLITFFVASSPKCVTKYEADLTNRVVVDEEVSLRRIPASPQLKGSQTRHWVFGLREVNYSLLIEP